MSNTPIELNDHALLAQTRAANPSAVIIVKVARSSRKLAYLPSRAQPRYVRVGRPSRYTNKPTASEPTPETDDA